MLRTASDDEKKGWCPQFCRAGSVYAPRGGLLSCGRSRHCPHEAIRVGRDDQVVPSLGNRSTAHNHIGKD